MSLTDEHLNLLATELSGWFGTPLLCRVHPRRISGPSDVLDGWHRWTNPRCSLGAERVPFYVFDPAYRRGLYSRNGDKQLARLLALFGHPDRAFAVIPEEWRTSVRDIEAHTNLPQSFALQIYRGGHRVRRYAKRQNFHLDAQAKLSNLRAGLEAHAEGEPFDLHDVAAIVG